jgi:hypothetical protein
MLTQSEFNEWTFRAGKLSWGFHLCGITFALYVFMAHSIKILIQGTGSVHTELPAQFNWPLFLLALLFMLVPILETGIRFVKVQNDNAS